ncbi:MAG: hypothetical protein R3B06_22700 [Kofleriaceae bacterium]
MLERWPAGPTTSQGIGPRAGCRVELDDAADEQRGVLVVTTALLADHSIGALLGRHPHRVQHCLTVRGRGPLGDVGALQHIEERRTCHPDGHDDMKVSALIELLEEQDPDAEVLVMMQQNWPFECSLAGVTTREAMLSADRDEDVDGDEDEEPRLERGTAKSDVFDRVEVQPWLAAEGRFSFVTSDPRAIDLACSASLKR